MNKANLLAFNVGSSSLKAALFDWPLGKEAALRAEVRGIGSAEPRLVVEGGDEEPAGSLPGHTAAGQLLLRRLREGRGASRLQRERLLGTVHRVVHGGARFTRPTQVDASVMQALAEVSALAPLHNPPALSVMRLVQESLPAVPMVAVFDTGFFAELPEHAQAYAVPAAWAREEPLRRYGFHGIAHQTLYERLVALSRPAAAPARVITLQLGHGCSAAALREGRPLETSMGFTPLEGLIMSTRPGDLDPGLLLRVAAEGRPWQVMEEELNRSSGLAGLSGASDDVRELLRLEADGHPGARLALAAFCHRIHKYLGAYAAVLGGLDAVVFGGGIGENSPEIRRRACAGLQWLGLELDEGANRACVGREALISAPGSRISVLVSPVREELSMAAAAARCLKLGRDSAGGRAAARSGFSGR